MLDKTKNYKIDVSQLDTAEEIYSKPNLTPAQENAYKAPPSDSKPNKV